VIDISAEDSEGMSRAEAKKRTRELDKRRREEENLRRLEEKRSVRDYKEEVGEGCGGRRCVGAACCVVCCVVLIIVSVVLSIYLMRRVNEEYGRARQGAKGDTVATHEDGYVPPSASTYDDNAPTQSPLNRRDETGPLDPNDGYNANDEASGCNTLPEKNIHDLGVRSMNGNYPRVAVHNGQAVVSTGEGTITFYELGQLQYCMNIWHLVR